MNIPKGTMNGTNVRDVHDQYTLRFRASDYCTYKTSISLHEYIVQKIKYWKTALRREQPIVISTRNIRSCPLLPLPFQEGKEALGAYRNHVYSLQLSHQKLLLLFTKLVNLISKRWVVGVLLCCAPCLFFIALLIPLPFSMLSHKRVKHSLPSFFLTTSL